MMRAWLALLVACGGSTTPAGGPDAPITGDAPAGPARGGPVRLEDHSLADDHGRFNALGATMFWAPWGYRHDRARLESELAFLAQHGFHYIRALGVVGDPAGSDFWDGREIDEQWPDYDAVIAGLTDLAYDQYGLRVQWTLIGDGQVSVPSEAERYALADRFIAMAETRRDKIILLEIANESFKNGFEGPDGDTQLRELAVYVRDRTDVLVAASSPARNDCTGVAELYAGGIADVATIHFDRTNNDIEGNWRPVRMPWDYETCSDVPVGANNEPAGPGSSVTSINEVPPLVAAPLASWISRLPLHVFHSRAGVRGDVPFADMTAATAQRHLMSLAPPDLASWQRADCRDAGAPVRCFARSGDTWIADAMWPDVADANAGAVRVLAGVSGDDFFGVAFGIRDRVQLEARRGLTVDVIDPQTGETLATHAAATGTVFEVGEGREVVILRGRLR